jgi:hypothetical protein
MEGKEGEQRETQRERGREKFSGVSSHESTNLIRKAPS